VTALAADQEALLRVLTRHGVELVVIGGVAAQVHGWQGATSDLDVAVSREATNVERLNAALVSVSAREGAIGELGTVFATRYGRLEVVGNADGIGGYEEWRRRARDVPVAEGLTVVVADPRDVLRSKEAAGRDKDRATLPHIRRDLLAAGAIGPDDVQGEVAEEGPPAPGPPAFLEVELGPRPASAGAARAWDMGAQMILEHRARWGVEDESTALGPEPADREQALDRGQVEKALRRTVRLLEQRRDD